MNQYFDLRQFEIIETISDLAEVLGVSVTSIYRYRRLFPVDVPSLPTFRIAVLNWAKANDLPRRRGPIGGRRSALVADLRSQGKSFSQIGKALGVTKQAAWKVWKRAQTGEQGYGLPEQIELTGERLERMLSIRREVF